MLVSCGSLFGGPGLLGPLAWFGPLVGVALPWLPAAPLQHQLAYAALPLSQGQGSALGSSPFFWVVPPLLTTKAPTQWYDYLPETLFAYRLSKHITTVKSPFALLYGQ